MDIIQSLYVLTAESTVPLVYDTEQQEHTSNPLEELMHKVQQYD